jgi:hypothetical protein
LLAPWLVGDALFERILICCCCFFKATTKLWLRMRGRIIHQSSLSCTNLVKKQPFLVLLLLFCTNQNHKSYSMQSKEKYKICDSDLIRKQSKFLRSISKFELLSKIYRMCQRTNLIQSEERFCLHCGYKLQTQMI